MRKRIAAGTVATLCLAAMLATPASATQARADQVSCGDVITEDTTLDSDLDCGELSGAFGLTIGADGVTLDLNGHTVSSACETECAGTAVIDDRGGYDGVRVLDGTIRSNGVAAGVALVDADTSALEGLTIGDGPRQTGQPAVEIRRSYSRPRTATRSPGARSTGESPFTWVTGSDSRTAPTTTGSWTASPAATGGAS